MKLNYSLINTCVGVVTSIVGILINILSTCLLKRNLESLVQAGNFVNVLDAMNEFQVSQLIHLSLYQCLYTCPYTNICCPVTSFFDQKELMKDESLPYLKKASSGMIETKFDTDENPLFKRSYVGVFLYLP